MLLVSLSYTYRWLLLCFNEYGINCYGWKLYDRKLNYLKNLKRKYINSIIRIGLAILNLGNNMKIF